ncbi:MAG: YitT family protein [Thermodesulfobacteriota bacterium]
MTFKEISLAQVGQNLFLIMAGSLIFVVGLNSILIPQAFLNGGLVGVSLIIVYLTPSLSVGWVYAVLNVPLLLLGWFSVSRRFIIYTIFGALFFSLAAETVKVAPLPIHNPILAAILAGLICGFGSGLILRSQGSAGGIDILAVYLYRKVSFRFGLTYLIVNSIVLIAGAVFFNLEMALYTLIYVFTSSRVTDAVITGFNVRKSVLVISDRSQEIADHIMTDLERGVTFLEGAGAYTGRQKRIIFSIVTLTELAEVKEMIFSLDPQAFVVVHDTLDVLGAKHGHLRVY